MENAVNNKRTTAATRELEESIFVTDGELLDQFSRSRSESAFAELVQRHNLILISDEIYAKHDLIAVVLGI